MPARPEPPTDDDVLNYLSGSSKPSSLREIAAALKLRHAGRRALSKSIAHLKRRKLIEEVRGGRYRVSGAKSRDAVSHEDGAPAAAGDRTGSAGDRGRRAGKTGAQRDSRDARPAEPSEQAPRLPLPDYSRDPNLLTGRLVAHHDGYGFVVPETPRPDLDGDLFIPPDQAADAMHGDRVIARIESRRAARQGSGRAEGRIIRVLGRAHPTLVGVFHYAPRGNFVLPYENRVHQQVIIPPGDELTPALRAAYAIVAPEKPAEPEHGKKRHAAHAKQSAATVARIPELDGAVVNVEIIRFPRPGVPPAGRVIEVLGRPGDFGVDIEILIRKHHLPHKFAPEVLEEARRAARPLTEAETDGRRDFRHLPIVTIDGETARDFDDAVYVERRPTGWHLQVHIADVAHYVPRYSELDREARLRGTSVYFPDRAVPMLPEELSNGICSLKPAEDRLVMSALLELDHHGEITSAEFTPGVIRSAERMTYTNVNLVLEGDAQASARYTALAERFRAMRDLALILNARRTRNGSMDFDLPERVLTFDAEGKITGIVRSERNIAHRLIEEFMLTANQAVARYLEDRGLPALHRIHEQPRPEKSFGFRGAGAGLWLFAGRPRPF